MEHKHKLIGPVLAAAIAVGSIAMAAEERANAPSGDGTQTGSMPHGGMMMGDGGMMNMMGMMEKCNRMMSSPTTSGVTVPQLPPGNEKLQLQMQAEIMQRTGEIVAKYAGKVRDEGSGR